MSVERKKWKIAAAALLALGGTYALYMSEQGNFHTVTPGLAYRSAQLRPAVMERYIKKYGIKSVLNLRNDTEGKDWYRAERELCERYGIEYFLVPMSQKKALSPKKSATVLEVLDTAPRPILIHCKAGADRSGLVSAMWKEYVDGETKEEAAGQLSLFYLHMPFGETQALDRFFSEWDPPDRPTPVR